MDESNPQQFSKQEKRELKQQQKVGEQKQRDRKRALQKFVRYLFVFLIIGGGIAWIVQYVQNKPSTPQEDIVSRSGIHWHPELSIVIKGELQEISANIGVLGVQREIHTHEPDGVLHLEKGGLVTKENTTLKNFFRIWGKEFNSECIFEFCNGEGGTVKMIVNGIENFEFENYVMQENDKVEIRYE